MELVYLILQDNMNLLGMLLQHYFQTQDNNFQWYRFFKSFVLFDLDMFQESIMFDSLHLQLNKILLEQVFVLRYLILQHNNIQPVKFQKLLFFLLFHNIFLRDNLNMQMQLFALQLRCMFQLLRRLGLLSPQDNNDQLVTQLLLFYRQGELHLKSNHNRNLSMWAL